MAAAKAETRIRRRKKTSFFRRFFGGCFGISSKVHGEGKSVKNNSALPLPVVKLHNIPPPITKQIHVIKDQEKKKKKKKQTQILAPPQDDHHHEFITKKTHDDMNSGKKKVKEKSNPAAPILIKGVEKQKSKLSHSVSLPPPTQRKEKTDDDKAKTTGREIKVAGEIEPIVGAVIIMVTLIVMLIWGKMCAILCTAAWFYFLPRYMDNNRPIKLKTGGGGDHRVDVDSWEYKKNVVLRGFLDRRN